LSNDGVEYSARSHRCAMNNFYARTHPRWSAYDYARAGVYFVTTITHGRRPIFGAPTRHGIALTAAGLAVHRRWLTVCDSFDGVVIDRFIVMPDHVHAIVVLLSTRNRTASLSDIVGWTKQRASRDIAMVPEPPPAPIWQRSFHDRIIRDADALERVRNYVMDNPSRAWRASRTIVSRRSGTPA